MGIAAVVAQIVVAVSVLFVWTIRFHVVEAEFKEYHLSVLTRSAVGAAKIALSTLLLVGIWYPQLVLFPALAMAFLMACAQVAHVVARHKLIKFLPSAFLLILSLFIAAVHAGLLPR